MQCPIESSRINYVLVLFLKFDGLRNGPKDCSYSRGGVRIVQAAWGVLVLPDQELSLSL